jgi:hypothetical protein
MGGCKAPITAFIVEAFVPMIKSTIIRLCQRGWVAPLASLSGGIEI